MTQNQNSKELPRRAARYMTKELAASMGYVRTPGGFRHKSLVHVLGPGQIVAKGPSGVATRDTATGAVVEFPAVGAQMQELAGEGGGWVTWADWTNGTGSPIRTFETSWVVPPPPLSDSGQLIYLFNALEDDAGDDILQPVLQWGLSGAGGGSYWSVASWYVDSSKHAFSTPVVCVNPGDNLVGVLSFDGSNYESEFQGIPGTSIIVQGLSPMVQATETLEVYGLTKNTDYPNTPVTRMSGIGLQLESGTASLAWQSEVMTNPAFGEHTDIVSNANPGGIVDLFY
jgi:hypothetical protein